MNTEPNQKPKDHKPAPGSAKPELAPGTEAKRVGGIEPAKRLAERDWEDSAKESGD